MTQVEKAIAVSARRRLTADHHTPWQVVHYILAFRQEAILKTKDGGTIRAVDWMASGPKYDGLSLFETTPYGGRGRPFTRPYAFEGHPTQFMGYMAMSDLPLDFAFQANDGKSITVKDIVNDAKMQVKEGPEITWTLWALAHYLPSNAEWINARGEAWSIERMVQIQTRESVLSGACGGTHGLFALAYARNRHLAAGRPLRGVWLEADQKIKRFVQEAKALQNSDGSFSSAFFRGAQYNPEFTGRLPANGHILEFLMISLSDKQLKEEWVRKGVAAVAKDLIDNRKVPCDCGPLYHAVDGLQLYRERTSPRPVVAQQEVEKASATVPATGAGSEKTPNKEVSPAGPVTVETNKVPTPVATPDQKEPADVKPGTEPVITPAVPEPKPAATESPAKPATDASEKPAP